MDWRQFLLICRRVLGKGAWESSVSDSWCAFTTFSSLEHSVNYWKCGFPDENELLDDRTMDGGLWSQSFSYDDIAHIIVPAQFYWESVKDGQFSSGYKKQDLKTLSSELEKSSIDFHLTDILLEVKLY
jgi:hypothetical protein